MEVAFLPVTASSFEVAAASADLGAKPTVAAADFPFFDALPWTDAPDTSPDPVMGSARREKPLQPPQDSPAGAPAVPAFWLGMLPIAGFTQFLPVDPSPSTDEALVTSEETDEKNPSVDSAATAAPLPVELSQSETQVEVDPETAFQFEPEGIDSSTNEASQPLVPDSPPSGPLDAEEPRPAPARHESVDRLQSMFVEAPAMVPPPLNMAGSIPAAIVPVSTAGICAPASAPEPNQPSQISTPLVSTEPAASFASSNRADHQATPTVFAPERKLAASDGESPGAPLPKAFSVPVIPHQEVFRLAVRSSMEAEQKPAVPTSEEQEAKVAISWPPPAAQSVAEEIKGGTIPAARETAEQPASLEPERAATTTPVAFSSLWVPPVSPAERSLAASTETAAQAAAPDTVHLPEPAGPPEDIRPASSLTDFTLTQSDGERVSLHLQQSSRGLEVRVAAADEGARQELRAGLDELLRRVEEQGLGTLWPLGANQAADEREAGGRHKQPSPEEWETRPSRRARSSTAEDSSAFTALLGLSNVRGKD